MSGDESYVDPDPDLPIDPDQPITSPARDRYHRARLAATIGRYLRRTPLGSSMVYALHGVWGSGKTSVLKLVELELLSSDITPLWFNPWYFSGTEQIASQFLRALAGHVRGSGRDLAHVGSALERYAELVLDVTSVMGSFVPASGALGAVARVVKARGAAMGRGGETLVGQKKEIEHALANASQPFVVFIDDIDRLDRGELRAVFKLVRLIADFPNVTYLLSYDRTRVEAAVAEEDGREYLAKIVQSTFDVPALRPGVLAREIERGVLDLAKARSPLELRPGRLQLILDEVVVPLSRTPRDVRRLLNALGPAVDLAADEVALEDLVALEAMRVFLPAAFDRLGDQRELLTRAIGSAGSEATKAREIQDLNVFIRLESTQTQVMQNLICRLFPRAGALIRNNLQTDFATARRERRVAAPDVLSIYLEKVVGDDRVPSRLVRELFEQFHDANFVHEKIRMLDYPLLADACSRLSDFAEDLPTEGFANGFMALAAAADRFPPPDTSLEGAESGLWRLLLNTLRRQEEIAKNDAVIHALLESRLCLSRKCWVLSVASSDGEVKQLVSTQALANGTEALHREIASAVGSSLLTGPRVLTVLWFAAKREGGRTTVVRLLDDNGVLRRLLTDARGTIQTSSRVYSFVHWSNLLGLFEGDESMLRSRLLDVLRDPESAAAASRSPRLGEALDEARALVDGRIAIAHEPVRQKSSREVPSRPGRPE